MGLHPCHFIGRCGYEPIGGEWILTFPSGGKIIRPPTFVLSLRYAATDQRKIAPFDGS